MVPGHEIAGIVVHVGENVTGFKVGDRAGVGCMIDCCRDCDQCNNADEQYCSKGKCVYTYNSTYWPEEYEGKGDKPTYGGYSKHIVVDSRFVFTIPENLDLAAAAPLLCAGITVYSPMINFGLKAGQHLGVMGMGGLGHMAIKIGKAMGAKVSVISRNNAKKEHCFKDFQIDGYLDMSNADEVKAHTKKFDFIINTISADHDINGALSLLNIDGKMILVGAPPVPLPVSAFAFIGGRRTLAGSLIGGTKQTQEMLDFCGKHNITSMIEVIKPDQINEYYDKVVAGNVLYRAVIDMANVE